MRRFKSLTTADVEAVYRLAEAYKHSPAEILSGTPIRPDTEKGRQLDDWMTRGLSPAHLALLRGIQQLSRDAQIELAALAWFGRGDAPFEQVREHAAKSYSPTLPYYLAEKRELGDYLKAGLQRA